MTQLTVHVQAKLHPSSAEEAEAIKIYQGLIAQGYSPRQIVTEAFNRLAGHTPEMFAERDEVKRLERLLGNMLEHALTDVLRRLKVDNRQELKRFVDEDDDTEFSEDFIKNVRKAVRPGFKRLKPNE